MQILQKLIIQFDVFLKLMFFLFQHEVNIQFYKI